MSLRTPNDVIYFAAVMYDPEKLSAPDAVVTELFGDAISKSAVFPFDHTSYYEPEMGGGLLKYFFAFGKPDEPGKLAIYKHAAIALEDKLAIDGKRIINIDPAYLAVEKVVVASTKNFTHRIYLADGIFGDLQLMRQRGHYAPLPWTYADYMRPEVHTFLDELSQRLMQK